MEFKFIAPDLRQLDLATAELVVGCVYSDIRPLRGLAGLLDFRLAGKLSRLCRDSFLEGGNGEALLVPGRPRLPFEKLLLFGMGARADFSDEVYSETVRRVSRALEALHVVRAVVELPGRGDGALTPERAAELLTPAIATDAHDAWWLVEDEAAQRRMGSKLLHERRSVRRA